MIQSAETSYRYTLMRNLMLPGLALEGVALFVMLNPSTADLEHDDPTIRRCVGFARRLGARELRVVNLFAARATSPALLATMVDPVGPLNDLVLVDEIARADFVIAAWGVHGALHGLGRTKNGQPRHPLYVRADAPLVEFAP